MRPLPCHSARTESENVRLAAGRSYTASASDESSRFGALAFGALTGVLSAELGGALSPAGCATLAGSRTAGKPIGKVFKRRCSAVGLGGFLTTIGPGVEAAAGSALGPAAS